MAKTKKTKTKPKKPTMKELATELASHVLFALKFLDTKRGGGLRMAKGEDGKLKMTVWQDDFMDSLDKCGYIIDRKTFWKQKERRR